LIRKPSNMPSNKRNSFKALILSHPWIAERFYRVLSLYRARKATHRDSSYGQSREDAWFLETLRAKNIPWAESGFYVDLGANHPVVFSATYLLYKAGWSGITVDPIPSLCALHRRLRSRDVCLNVGVGAVNQERRFWETAPDFFSSFSEEDTKRAQERGLCTMLRETNVSLVTPAEILQSVPGGRRVNYLSIDTEGLDGEILRNWPWEQSMPDVISCEASALVGQESEASSVLRARGYGMLKQFPVCVFWASPHFAEQADNQTSLSFRADP
jgi:FkbM family methyltransferase